MTLTPEQQSVRAKGIGASETPSLVGADPCRKPIDIYLRKLGLTENAETFHTKRGTYLEPALREWASDEIGIKFRPCQSLVLADHPRVLATPDGIDESGKTVLELKSPGPRTCDEWGEDESDAPDRYVIQVCQQILVTNADHGFLAALLDGDLRVYHIERDRELEGVLVDSIEKFWRDHIEKQIPPEVDGSGSWGEFIKARYPRSTRTELIVADSRTEEIVSQYRKAREQAYVADVAEEILRQKLQFIIGDGAGLQGPWGKIYWKNNKPRTVTDWEALAKSLKPAPEKISEFTNERPGARPFSPKFKKEKE